MLLDPYGFGGGYGINPLSLLQMAGTYALNPGILASTQTPIPYTGWWNDEFGRSPLLGKLTDAASFGLGGGRPNEGILSGYNRMAGLNVPGTPTLPNAPNLSPFGEAVSAAVPGGPQTQEASNLLMRQAGGFGGGPLRSTAENVLTGAMGYTPSAQLSPETRLLQSALQPNLDYNINRTLNNISANWARRFGGAKPFESGLGPLALRELTPLLSSNQLALTNAENQLRAEQRARQFAGAEAVPGFENLYRSGVQNTAEALAGLGQAGFGRTLSAGGFGAGLANTGFQNQMQQAQQDYLNRMQNFYGGMGQAQGQFGMGLQSGQYGLQAMGLGGQLAHMEMPAKKPLFTPPQNLAALGGGAIPPLTPPMPNLSGMTSTAGGGGPGPGTPYLQGPNGTIFYMGPDGFIRKITPPGTGGTGTGGTANSVPGISMVQVGISADGKPIYKMPDGRTYVPDGKGGFTQYQGAGGTGGPSFPGLPAPSTGGGGGGAGAGGAAFPPFADDFATGGNGNLWNLPLGGLGIGSGGPGLGTGAGPNLLTNVGGNTALVGMPPGGSPGTPGEGGANLDVAAGMMGGLVPGGMGGYQVPGTGSGPNLLTNVGGNTALVGTTGATGFAGRPGGVDIFGSGGVPPDPGILSRTAIGAMGGYGGPGGTGFAGVPGGVVMFGGGDTGRTSGPNFPGSPGYPSPGATGGNGNLWNLPLGGLGIGSGGPGLGTGAGPNLLTNVGGNTALVGMPPGGSPGTPGEGGANLDVAAGMMGGLVPGGMGGYQVPGTGSGPNLLTNVGGNTALVGTAGGTQPSASLDIRGGDMSGPGASTLLTGQPGFTKVTGPGDLTAMMLPGDTKFRSGTVADTGHDYMGGLLPAPIYGGAQGSVPPSGASGTRAAGGGLTTRSSSLLSPTATSQPAMGTMTKNQVLYSGLGSYTPPSASSDPGHVATAQEYETWMSGLRDNAITAFRASHGSDVPLDAKWLSDYLIPRGAPPMSPEYLTGQQGTGLAPGGAVYGGGGFGGAPTSTAGGTGGATPTTDMGTPDAAQALQNEINQRFGGGGPYTQKIGQIMGQPNAMSALDALRATAGAQGLTPDQVNNFAFSLAGLQGLPPQLAPQMAKKQLDDAYFTGALTPEQRAAALAYATAINPAVGGGAGTAAPSGPAPTNAPAVFGGAGGFQGQAPRPVDPWQGPMAPPSGPTHTEYWNAPWNPGYDPTGPYSTHVFPGPLTNPALGPPPGGSAYGWQSAASFTGGLGPVSEPAAAASSPTPYTFNITGPGSEPLPPGTSPFPTTGTVAQQQISAPPRPSVEPGFTGSYPMGVPMPTVGGVPMTAPGTAPSPPMPLSPSAPGAVPPPPGAPPTGQAGPSMGTDYWGTGAGGPAAITGANPPTPPGSELQVKGGGTGIGQGYTGPWGQRAGPSGQEPQPSSGRGASPPGSELEIKGGGTGRPTVAGAMGIDLSQYLGGPGPGMPWKPLPPQPGIPSFPFRSGGNVALPPQQGGEGFDGTGTPGLPPGATGVTEPTAPGGLGRFGGAGSNPGGVPISAAGGPPAGWQEQQANYRRQQESWMPGGENFGGGQPPPTGPGQEGSPAYAGGGGQSGGWPGGVPDRFAGYRTPPLPPGWNPEARRYNWFFSGAPSPTPFAGGWTPPNSGQWGLSRYGEPMQNSLPGMWNPATNSYTGTAAARGQYGALPTPGTQGTPTGFGGFSSFGLGTPSGSSTGYYGGASGSMFGGMPAGTSMGVTGVQAQRPRTRIFGQPNATMTGLAA